MAGAAAMAAAIVAMAMLCAWSEASTTAESKATEVPAELVSCSEEAAVTAFSRGDISLARAELAAYKDSPKSVRECAVRVWKSGIASLIEIPQDAMPAGHEEAAHSKVLEQLGSSGCDARVEDGSWLDIPRLQEVLVCVHTGGRTLILEQDGFLRAFDMPTVLWPAGFALTAWVTAHCQLLTGRILELGAGVGAPSIAASLCGDNSVVATDKAPHSLINVRTNARINGAHVQAWLLDWENDTSVDLTVATGKFDTILGAGLAPHRWTGAMWAVLARLLRPATGRVVLSHGTGDLDTTAGQHGSFHVEEVVAGDEYGLQTRWGTPSEFEIVVLRFGADEL